MLSAFLVGASVSTGNPTMTAKPIGRGSYATVTAGFAADSGANTMAEWEHITTFIIPGRPKPKGRPRFTRQGHAYTPESTRAAERNVIDLFELACPLWEPTLEDVRLTLDVCFQYGRVADLDNIAKLVSDALNGYAYVDDRQVRKLDVTGFENAGDSAGVVVSLAIYKGES